METNTPNDWTCTAYGEDGARYGLRCFFAEATDRDCATRSTCESRLASERRRMFDRLQELAVTGDDVYREIAREIHHPDQLLGGPLSDTAE